MHPANSDLPPNLSRGVWEASRPEDERMAPAEALSTWHPQWGDRCQQIVWIGIGMDRAAITTMLDGCLLTDEEMALGPDGWASAFDDDLPEWGVEDHGDEEEED